MARRRTSYYAREYPMTDEARAWLKENIVAVVAEAYENWHTLNDAYREESARWGRSMRAPEPTLTVSFLRDLLRLRHSGFDALTIPPECIIDGRIRSAADALVRDGWLLRSTGLGLSGQEAKMYEPGPKMER